MKVLVLNTRGLHLGYLGCYGSEWVPTPNLDRLAGEGVVFDQHLADHPNLTWPREGAHRSAWTGRFGPPLVAQASSENALAGEVGALFLPFPEWDQAVAGPWLDVLSRDQYLLWLDLPGLGPPWDASDEHLAPFFEQASDDAEEEPLSPWQDPPVGPIDLGGLDLDRAQCTYAAMVTEVDARIGSLLDSLNARDLLDEVLVIVTADCGLALGEHGVIGPHRAWLHEEVVHVPLVMRLPGAAQAGRRVAALTQPIDLFATVLEAFHRPLPIHQGASLWPLLRGECEQIRPYACAGLQVGDGIEWALRTPHWACVLPLQVPPEDPPRAPQLYVKPDDRWEVNDVRQHHLELAEQMEKTLHAFAAAARQPGPLHMPELHENPQTGAEP